jgi:nicotinamidase-related amidase
MDALLVVDMQNAWLNSGISRLDRDGVIRRINHAARCMRQRGGKVIFIRHCDDDAQIGTPEWHVDSDLAVDALDLLIDKTACDAFANTDLLMELMGNGANKLFICGLATEFCVDTTLRAALSHGFDVVGLSDAHTTGDRPHLSAAQVIEHHNWVWANLAAPLGRQIQVCTVDEAFEN